MAGRRAGGRNRGAMVAALSAADNDRAVLDGQFDRSACGARSGAARSRAARAIGVVCIHRIQIMAQARSTKPLKAVTTGTWTRVKAACSDPVGAVLHVLYARLSAVTSDARFGSIDGDRKSNTLDT